MRPTTHTGGRWLRAACGLVALVVVPAVAAPAAAGSPVPEPGVVAVSRTLAPPGPAIAPGGIVFPIVGRITSWHDDYHEARPIGHEQGNDVGTDPGTPVVAAVAGKVERMWWGGAGWTLRLTAANGDQFIYIHLGLNGRPRTAYVPGLRTGDHVAQGEQVGWSGYSGNASASFPHVEIQYLPGGRTPVDPYQLLQAAPRLLFAAPRARPGVPRPDLRLRVSGTVAGSWQTGAVTSLRVTVTEASLSTGAKVPGADDLTLRVPPGATILRDGAPVAIGDLEPLDAVTVVSAPLAPTVAQQLGAADAIPADQVKAVTNVTPRR